MKLDVEITKENLLKLVKWILLKPLKWILLEFFGLRFILRKLKPPLKEELEEEQKKKIRPPATIGLWLIGLYIAMFGIAQQRYENRIDVIENRANAIYIQLSTPTYKKALSRIARVQNMRCPQNPYIINPINIFTWKLFPTTFKSLFGEDTLYIEMVEQLKETVEDWKDSLSNVNLSEAHLEGAKLEGAHLEGAKLEGAHLEGAYLGGAYLDSANLRGAHLEGIKGLTINQLKTVKILFEVKGLSAELLKQVKEQCPEKLATRYNSKEHEWCVDSTYLKEILADTSEREGIW